jgi:uncharacterized protein YgiM (DUF1202 family)
MTRRLRHLLATGVMLAVTNGSALAEVVTANQSTEVRQRAGEQSSVVMTVKSGQSMTVLSKDGRWVKVRVKGRTGYVARSTIEGDDGGDIQRNTRRRPFVDGRSTGRTFGGEGPDDRVGADATGDQGDSGDEGDDGDKSDRKPKKEKTKVKSKPRHDEEDDTTGDDEDAIDKESTSKDEDDRVRVRLNARTVLRADPSKKAPKIMTGTSGERFFLVEKRGKWSLLETEDGDKSGWVLTRMTGDSSASGPRARIFDASANLGVTLIKQTMALAGGSTKFPDAYGISTSSLTLALGGELLVPYKDDYWIGGQVTYAGTKALPGLSYMGTNIPITLHNFNVRGEFGYDFHSSSGMRVVGRLGYHYDAFLVPVDNKATLPAEAFRGVIIGAAVDVPKVTDVIAIRASLDAVVLGTRSQTTNLEDGASPSTFAAFVGLSGQYRWKPDITFTANYDLGYFSNSFGPPIATSKRMHMGTGGSRTDVFHTISIGAKKAF